MNRMVRLDAGGPVNDALFEAGGPVLERLVADLDRLPPAMRGSVAFTVLSTLAGNMLATLDRSQRVRVRRRFDASIDEVIRAAKAVATPGGTPH